MIKFTQIPDKLPYPPIHRARISTLHSDMISAAAEIYNGRFTQRKQIIDAFNQVSYVVVSQDAFPADWTPAKLFGACSVDSDVIRAKLGQLYIVEKNIDWDIDPIESVTDPAVVAEVPVMEVPAVLASNPTPKEDLYLQPPIVPRFSITPWMSQTIGPDTFTIYPSEPRIPTKQNEISVTTDVSLMTDSDLMRLYPNQIIRTRAASMYSPVPGIEYHSELGLILPINGYTREELIQNIIEYPHIYKLQRVIDDQLSVFYTTIELNGELMNVADAWQLLPEAAIIPYTADFVKEYVVRRYLMERDRGTIHKYPMYGTLDKMLTLFAPASKYVEWGYPNVVDIARQCVSARVRYKSSRNPIIRRLRNE